MKAIHMARQLAHILLLAVLGLAHSYPVYQFPAFDLNTLGMFAAQNPSVEQAFQHKWGGSNLYGPSGSTMAETTGRSGVVSPAEAGGSVDARQVIDSNSWNTIFGSGSTTWGSSLSQGTGNPMGAAEMFSKSQTFGASPFGGFSGSRTFGGGTGSGMGSNSLSRINTMSKTLRTGSGTGSESFTTGQSSQSNGGGRVDIQNGSSSIYFSPLSFTSANAGGSASGGGGSSGNGGPGNTQAGVHTITNTTPFMSSSRSSARSG